MQETILAFAALLVVATLVLNNQRTAFFAQRDAHMRDMEAAAESYGEMRLKRISESVAFDERVVGNSGRHLSVEDLTPHASFGPDDFETPKTFDDLDDFDGFVDQTTAFAWGEGQYRFKATYSVRYVDTELGDEAAPGNTFSKEIMVLVESLEFGAESEEVLARAVVKRTVDMM